MPYYNTYTSSCKQICVGINYDRVVTTFYVHSINSCIL